MNIQMNYCLSEKRSSPEPILLDNYKKGSTLAALCKKVVSCKCSYDDIAEDIEDRAYEKCEQGKFNYALKHLRIVAAFFEDLKNKNEEIARDLADVYLLIGQMHQYCNQLEKSIEWFVMAITVDDQYSVPYHSCAISYMKLNRCQDAVRCLEQEINIAPGNYYSYLMLSDIYSNLNMGKMVETVLRELLQRDPTNIQGLHRLIKYYQDSDSSIDVALLRKRLLSAKSQINRVEAIIRTYHLCCERRYFDAITFIEKWHQNASEVTIAHLIKAYIYGELHQYRKKRIELARFKELNNDSEELIIPKLEEFGHIFGKKLEKKLAHRLDFSFPYQKS